MIHYFNRVGEFRGYPAGSSYENKDKYSSLVQFFNLTSTSCYVYSFIGVVDRTMVEEFLGELKNLGITELLYEKSDQFFLRGSEKLDMLSNIYKLVL